MSIWDGWTFIVQVLCLLFVAFVIGATWWDGRKRRNRRIGLPLIRRNGQFRDG